MSSNSTPRQHIVFLTGAGVSAESGLETFRGEDGMWTDKERVRLASAGALYYDTEKCLDFYNSLRKRIAEAEPNEAHRLMAGLEKDYEVTVITQNVDNLHERAGSTRVIHLHGELSKVCSSDNRTTCIKEYPLDVPIRLGDQAEDGSQLRPSVVMFGEYVGSTDEAVSCIREADIFVVVGTSLQIHPAAGFVKYAHHEIPKFVIDPADMDLCVQLGFTHFKTTASEGMRRLVETLRTSRIHNSPFPRTAGAGNPNFKDMDKDFIATMLKIYTLGAIDTFGPEAIVVLNGGEPGEYENNPTIKEYEAKGYRLCDANMFGKDLERYEALTFCKKKTP